MIKKARETDANDVAWIDLDLSATSLMLMVSINDTVIKYWKNMDTITINIKKRYKLKHNEIKICQQKRIQLLMQYLNHWKIKATGKISEKKRRHGQHWMKKL